LFHFFFVSNFKKWRVFGTQLFFSATGFFQKAHFLFTNTKRFQMEAAIHHVQHHYSRIAKSITWDVKKNELALTFSSSSTPVHDYTFLFNIPNDFPKAK
jgi:hypothetical protein